jgi:pSer/pThr/pTyr-binding forkhead associated (FHA) protein
MAVLSLKYKNKALDSFPIGMGDTFIIGRHDGNDIVIDNLAVSFHHAKIESIGDEFLLIDLASENGTFVNEQRIKAHWLVDGDAVTIGKHTLHFSDPKNQALPDRFGTSIVRTMQMDTTKFREMLRKNNMAVPPEADAKRTVVPVLAFLSEPRKDFQLGDRPAVIGKDLTADIPARGMFVAGKAAVINRVEDGWYISRVGGLVRVKLNGDPVRKATRLQRLDVISLGKLKMQFLERA